MTRSARHLPAASAVILGLLMVAQADNPGSLCPPAGTETAGYCQDTARIEEVPHIGRSHLVVYTHVLALASAVSDDG